MEDKIFIEKTALPGLLKGAPDRLLVNGVCMIEGAEAIESELHQLMFAPLVA